ncbi:hypothetical protein [Mucilaginibacter myungsuensis]|uniref:Uncharacterized protein n=1 Tax=Mucilaginibacter myungsuensis TaxID=649104 RepID=A0A929KV69_9SPHI|nr:hypothetical protein [Mucilaginibacter myungsuensis]MBE9662186.1 hypothetical protein [Mucilaginibacter myungsuensis]MDN3599380.1 hypothetical protein [Mucilaginibacter myungsuensis]
MINPDTPIEKKEVNGVEFLTYLQKYTKIYNLKITDNVDVQQSIILRGDTVEIANCDFEGELFFRANPSVKKFHLLDCTLKKRFLLFNSNLELVNLARSTFLQYFAFKNLYAKILTIENCAINNSKELRLHEFAVDNFSFVNNEASNDIYIKPLAAKVVFLKGNDKKYQVTLSGRSDNGIYDQIRLFCYSQHRTDFVFFNINADMVQVVGSLKDSTIYTNNLSIRLGILDHFFNDGNLKISNLQPVSTNSRLVIKKSVLGKTQINNCDFSKFQTVNLENSNILEITPVNVVLCNNKNIASSNLFSTKENFRQLKIVSQKNEDIDNKLIYARHEMNTLLTIAKETNASFNDKFILYTSWLSNDFGNNWSRALIWLLSVSLLFYTAIKYLLGYVYFDVLLIGDEIGKFLIFLNPLHQFEKLFGADANNQNTNGAILVDGISKIIGAYLLYQFVNAFRKYVKK